MTKSKRKSDSKSTLNDPSARSLRTVRRARAIRTPFLTQAEMKPMADMVWNDLTKHNEEAPENCDCHFCTAKRTGEQATVEQFRDGSDNPAAIQAKMDAVAAQPAPSGLAETV